MAHDRGLAEFSEILRAGDAYPAFTGIGLEEIPDSLDRLEKGAVTGCLVALLSPLTCVTPR